MATIIPLTPEYKDKIAPPYGNPISESLLNAAIEKARRGTLLSLDDILTNPAFCDNMGAYVSAHQDELVKNGVPIFPDFFIEHTRALMASTLLNTGLAYAHADGAEYGQIVTKNRQVLSKELALHNERLSSDNKNVLNAFSMSFHELNSLHFQTVHFHHDNPHCYVGNCVVDASEMSNITLTTLAAVLAYKNYWNARLQNELLALYLANEDGTIKRYVTGLCSEIGKKEGYYTSPLAEYNQIDPGVLVLFQLDENGAIAQFTPRAVNVLQIVTAEPLTVIDQNAV